MYQYSSSNYSHDTYLSSPLKIFSTLARVGDEFPYLGVVDDWAVWRLGLSKEHGLQMVVPALNSSPNLGNKHFTNIIYVNRQQESLISLGKKFASWTEISQ